MLLLNPGDSTTSCVVPIPNEMNFVFLLETMASTTSHIIPTYGPTSTTSCVVLTYGPTSATSCTDPTYGPISTTSWTNLFYVHT